MPDDDGAAFVRELIEGARRSILVKMFEFDCPKITDALVAARKRGVEVHVLLNAVRSSGLRPNDGTFASLREAGVDVNWASPLFAITHEKSMVVDGERVLIATFNFSPKYFTRTRDYGLLIEDPAVVDEVTSCFETDRRGEPHVLREGSPLAWGNQNARRAVADFIDSAKKQLIIQHPKFRDSTILDHVLCARDRGVHVRFLCGGRHGIEDRDVLATFSYQRILARAGVHLKRQRHLKLHAKVLMADGERAMVGSMNIDRDAYEIRRELGIVFEDADVVKQLKKVFEADWDEAKHWEAPDPLLLQPKESDEEPDPVPAIMHV